MGFNSGFKRLKLLQSFCVQCFRRLEFLIFFLKFQKHFTRSVYVTVRSGSHFSHLRISAKRKQLDLKLRNMYWIIRRKSKLSLANKLLVYKAILKPIWTYGIQLWGTASNSNIDILERFQLKVLRIITDAPWYVPNAVIKHDLHVPSVGQEVRTFSVTYHARLEGHPNDLATSLLQQPPHNRRLKRY